MNLTASSAETKVIAGLAAAVAVIIAMSAIRFQALRSFREHDRMVAHTNVVLLEITRAASEFQGAQSKARYYLRSRDSQFLDSYTAARQSALDHLVALRKLTTDNPRQQKRLDNLDKLATHRLALVSTLLDARHNDSAPAQISSVVEDLGVTSRQMDRITDAMQREEEDLLNRRQVEANTAALWNVVTFGFGGFLSLFLVGGAGILVRRDLAARRASEALLLESKERFRLLVESMKDDAILLLDPEGAIATSSGGAERIIGYRADEIVGSNFRRLYLPADIEQREPERQLEIAAHTGKFETEAWRIRNDDAHFLASVVITAIHDHQGKLINFATVMRDLTQQRQAEEALMRQSRLLREQAELLELTQDAIIVREIDGRITFWNRGAERLYGWSREEAVGKYSHALLQTKFPRPLEEVDLELRQTRYWEGELEHVKRDGGHISVASRWALRQAYHDSGSSGVLEINSDVTARRVAAEALQKSEEQTRLVLNSAAEAICGINLEGKCTFCNPSCLRLLGYGDAEELLGKNMHSLTHHSRSDGRPYPVNECSIAGVIRYQREVHRDDDIFWRKDGTNFPAEFWAHPVYRNNEVIGAVVTFVDITNRKQTEERLKAATEAAESANRAKSDFLARMSHEIRTPMNSICGMADLLWDTQLGSEQREYVRVFRTSAEHLLDLINDILDLSKIEAGGMTLESTGFDVVQTVEECLELLANRAHQKKLDLNFYLGDDVPAAVMGDPARLQQILLNLVGNAIKFTESGEILVRVEAGQKTDDTIRLCFAVSDTGSGIAADQQKRIFDSFAQADSSITRRFGGTGLGLAIAKHLVELMGGELSVSSELGKGSTFSFEAELKTCDALESAASQAIQNLKDLKALIIDDNATNRMILRETLRRWGIVVNEAMAGLEGLDILKSARQNNTRYDLVFLDNHMPGLSGMEVASQMCKDFPSGGPAVLMLSSDFPAADTTKLRELGIEVFLAKPIKRLKLLEAILQVIGAKPAAAEWKQEPKPASQHQQPAWILIAEDSPDNLYLIQAYLKDTLYTIDAVENGELALERVQSASYDLVLMDVQMPVMDGYSATRAIRDWERENNVKPTPIIALTAHALAADAAKSAEAGCTAYLSKPVSKANLLETIGRYLQQDASAGSWKVSRLIPPELEELVPNYLERRSEDIQKLMEALANHDYETIRIAGHNMKGTGTSYGFAEITQAGAMIESAARTQDEAKLRRQIQTLAACLDQINEERLIGHSSEI